MAVTRAQYKKEKLRQAKVKATSANIVNEVVNNPLFMYLASETSAIGTKLVRAHTMLSQTERQRDNLSVSYQLMQERCEALTNDNEAIQRKYDALIEATSRLLEMSYQAERREFFVELQQIQWSHDVEITELDDYDSDATEIVDLTDM